jgi:glucans biosynthesis protein C
MKTERMHALDALRGSMMLLGIFVHAATPFFVFRLSGMPSVVAPMHMDVAFDMLAAFLHAFRVPAFFLVAGFFVALLIHERGVFAMIRNRMERIGIPFILSMLFLWPLIAYGVVIASSSLQGASFLSALKALPHIPLFPPQPAHLWFLYYLLLLSIGTWCIAFLARKKIAQMLPKGNTVFLALGAITVIALLIGRPDRDMTGALHSFVIFLPILAYQSVFYVIGLLAYHERRILSLLRTWAWGFLVCGVAAFVVSEIFFTPLERAVPLLLVFGVTGVFLRYAERERAWVRYLADASYWVYLIHLPILLLFIALLYPLTLPNWLLYLGACVGTGTVSLVSYHLFVRSTFIGKILSGRRYPKRTKH